MIKRPFAAVLEPASEINVCPELIREVRQGLLSRPRSLAPWMFYDRTGSELFERITALPEYYLTRTEKYILNEHADAIIAESHADRRRPLRILELGAGTASKTYTLIEAALRLQTKVLYMPVDVSAHALNIACRIIEEEFPAVQTKPLNRDYVEQPLQLAAFPGSTLVLYLGSSIGNFTPSEARTILYNISCQLQPGDAMVLGTDLAKEVSTLLAAYDDREGITAAFNLNVLHRLNRELGANFDREAFFHRVRWNQTESRIEMHLESKAAQRVVIPAAELEIDFHKGETIHTENSYKFSVDSLRQLWTDSSFEVGRIWTDKHARYAVTLAHPSTSRTTAQVTVNRD